MLTYATGVEYVREQDGLVASFMKHNPDRAVMRFCVENYWGEGWQARSNQRIHWLAYMAFALDECILMLDADARVRRHIEKPSRPFDIAAQDWTADRSRISTGTLWLNNTPRARDLLRLWLDRMEDDVSNEVTLASVITDIDGLRYYELPREHSAPCSDAYQWAGKLDYDSAIVHWNRSRHVVLGQEDWPPDEATRESATT